MGGEPWETIGLWLVSVKKCRQGIYINGFKLCNYTLIII